MHRMQPPSTRIDGNGERSQTTKATARTQINPSASSSWDASHNNNGRGGNSDKPAASSGHFLPQQQQQQLQTHHHHHHHTTTSSMLQFLCTRTRVFLLGFLIGAIFVRPFTIGLPDELEQHHEQTSVVKAVVGKTAAAAAAAVVPNRQQQQKKKKLVAMEDAASKKLTTTTIRGAPQQQQQQQRQSQAAQPIVKPSLEARKLQLAKVDALAAAVDTNAAARREEVIDFERQPGVVIATKIHGGNYMKQLLQSMCLLKAAYNHRPQYDIVIFATEALSESDERELKEVAHPANLQVVLDPYTLHDHLQDMTDDQRVDLLKRCSVNSTEQLFWWTRCCEEGSQGDCMPLSYTWQSEFRSLHIWQKDALKPYKYMMWFDSDAFPTHVWEQDPVAVMVRNQLKILFDNFPQGSSAGYDLRDKIMQAYKGDTLCYLKLVDGHLEAKGGSCLKPRIPNIHGFFHITELDFYRNKENLNWSRIMIGENKFSRRWDDQLAVTIPAAMRAPDKAWDMNQNNITLDIYHNSFYDGHRRWRWTGKGGGGFQTWWRLYSKEKFPEGRKMCQALIRNGG